MTKLISQDATSITFHPMETRTYDHQRIFSRATQARDIAEPLRSFDAGTPLRMALATMRAQGVPVAGVRVNGLVTGYITLDAPEDGACGDALQPFEGLIILDDAAPIADVVSALKVNDCVFLRWLGVVNGVITRDDLQDPPFRMWLFGLITAIEMQFGKMIHARFNDESWMQYVSPARVEKARELLAERQRRGQSPSLLDCLQFADKAQIVVRDETLRKRAGFVSRRRGDEAIAGIERLRNNLAHAQDIISHDWEIIVALVDNLDRLMHLGRRNT
jgi:hypothetical protein